MNINQIKVRRFKDTNYTLVTPEMAEKLLAMNSKENRKISEVVVRRYESDLLSGRWGITNMDPIGVKLDKNGRIIELKDGQHRLTAIVRSGVVGKFEFAEVPPNAFQYLDQGKNRMTTDFIHEPNAKKLSSLGNRILRTREFNLPLTSIVSISLNSSAVNITPQMVLDYLYKCEEEFPEWQECIHQGIKLREALYKKGSVATCSYFCWMLKWLAEDKHLDDYVCELADELTDNISIRLFKNFYQQILVSGISFREDNLLAHLLWTYDHFYECTCKKYPATKVYKTLDKYDLLIAKKKITKLHSEKK